MSIAKRTEYKGIPLLALMSSPEDGFPMKIGVRKAKLIVENIDAIRSFVNDNFQGNVVQQHEEPEFP